MSNERRDSDYLSDILEAIRRIQEYTQGMDWEKFILDYETQDAVVRNLEVMGEASKNITEETRAYIHGCLGKIWLESGIN
jgi:uncharacterized protein with HEPN domain